LNAPAQSFVLIACERGIGRMQASACAKRWRLGNTDPAKLKPHERMDASGIRNSPCRACPHGQARAEAGAHEAAAMLVRASDISALAAAAKPAEPQRRPAELSAPAVAATLPPAPLMRTSDQVCAACKQTFKPKPGAGRRPVYCQRPDCLEARKAGPRKQRAQPGGRTETRVCALPSCRSEFTVTSHRGPLPIYCKPECARRAELDSSRERKRLIRRADGVEERAYTRVALVVASAEPPTRREKVIDMPTDGRTNAEPETSFDRAKRRTDARRQLKEIVSRFTVDQALDLLADVMVELESDAEAAQ
jgi:hypothetical protein